MANRINNIKDKITSGVNFVIQGLPGTAKTALIIKAATELGIEYIVVDGSKTEPSDFRPIHTDGGILPPKSINEINGKLVILINNESTELVNMITQAQIKSLAIVL